MRIKKKIQIGITLIVFGTLMFLFAINPHCAASDAPVVSTQNTDADSSTNVDTGSVPAGGYKTGTASPLVNFPGGGSAGGIITVGGQGSTVFSAETYDNKPLHPLIRALYYAKDVKSTDVFFLCLSIVACLVAFSIQRQSIEFLRMLIEGKEKALDPCVGATTSWVLFIIIFGICMFYGVASAQQKSGYLFVGDFIDHDGWGAAVASPRAFANAFLIASVAPGFIGICKFIVGALILHSRRVGFRGVTRLLATKEEAGPALEHIETSLHSLNARFLALETQRARNINVKSEEKRSDDMAFVLTLAFAFVVITAVLVLALALITPASLYALIPIIVLVLILIGAIALTRGGKLKQHSMMEVFRRAFDLIRRRDKFGARPRKISGTHDDSTNDNL